MNTLRSALIAVGLVCTAPAISHAAVPVEMRTLTPNNHTAAINLTANPTATDSPDASTDQTSMMWKLYQQVQDLQQEVRSLRGRFESQEQQLDQTDKELKARFTDLDQRFDQFKTQLPTPPSSEAVSTTTPPMTASTEPQTTASTVGTTPPTSNTATPPIPDADKRAYVSAYDAYKAGGAAKAIEPMHAFIRNYPTSVYVPNAHYWLGEFYLAITPPDFKQAAQSFAVTSTTYPKSAKAAAATYRLATMADVDNRPAEATRLMTRLTTDYIGTQEAGFADNYLNTHRTKPTITKPTVTKPVSVATKPAKPLSTPTTPKVPNNNTKRTELAPPFPTSGTSKANSNTKRTDPQTPPRDTVKTKTASLSKNTP
jgi:TolA-binding protein